MAILGSGEPQISLGNQNILASSISPTDAIASYRLTSGGDVQTSNTNPTSYGDVGDWISPKAGMSNYEARLTVNSGTTPSGSATGSWLALSSTLTWTITDTSSGGGAVTSNCTIEIRHATSL